MAYFDSEHPTHLAEPVSSGSRLPRAGLVAFLRAGSVAAYGGLRSRLFAACSISWATASGFDTYTA